MAYVQYTVDTTLLQIFSRLVCYNRAMQERIAIMGGTFDPVHIGHLAISDEARWALQADRVLLVPAAQQPLKAGQTPGASAAHRLRMVQLAVADNSAFVACDLELRRGGVSYTVDTVVAIKEAYPMADLVFVLGADAVALLPRWYQVDRLLALCRFAVLQRPGHTLALDAVLSALPALRERLTLIDGPLLTVAASEIRTRIGRGQPVRYLVPPAVWAYIEQHKLYTS